MSETITDEYINELVRTAEAIGEAILKDLNDLDKEKEEAENKLSEIKKII